MTKSFFKFKFVLLAIVLGTISLHVSQLSAGRWIIGSDGLGYYAHIRSLVIDHDLQYGNEFRDFNPFHHVVQDFQKPTRTGHVANKYPIGPALLWAPFFIAAHLLTISLNLFGCHFPVDGYSLFYQLFIGFGTTFYGILGLCYIFAICRRYFSEQVTVSAIATIFLSTNLIYYFAREPSMSHMLSMFAVSQFLYLSLRDFAEKTVRSFMICGLAAGLMILMRYQNVFFMVVSLIGLSLNCCRGGLSWPGVRRFFGHGLVFLAAVGLVLLPQLIVLKIIFGFNPVASQSLNHGVAVNIAGAGDYTVSDFNFLTPKLWCVLFSPHHGLIYWTPIILVCLIGMIVFARTNRLQGAILFICFIFQWYINAAWRGWTFGDAFGARAFVNCTAIFTVGLAAVFDRCPLPKWVTGFIVLILVAANLSLMAQFILNIIPHTEPVTWAAVFQGNLKLMAELKFKILQMCTMLK